MTWGAVAVGVGTAVAGAFGANASKSAANKQEKASKQAIALQREMWNTTRNDLGPYRNAGTTALPSLIDLVTNPQAQADYVQTNPLARAQAQLSADTLMANQAARGMLGSGSTANALQQQYLAQGEGILNNQTNRLMGLVGIGQNSAAGSAAANMQAGNALSSLVQGIGNSQAAGAVGQSNAWGDAAGQFAGFLGQYMNRNKTPQGA